jgi:hypothetical protein
VGNIYDYTEKKTKLETRLSQLSIVAIKGQDTVAGILIAAAELSTTEAGGVLVPKFWAFPAISFFLRD